MIELPIWLVALAVLGVLLIVVGGWSLLVAGSRADDLSEKLRERNE